MLLRLIWTYFDLPVAASGRLRLGFHASLPNPIASSGEVDADGMELLKRKGCIPQPAPDWSYQFAGPWTLAS